MDHMGLFSGTTGEFTLSHEEHKKIIEETIRIADKRIQL